MSNIGTYDTKTARDISLAQLSAILQDVGSSKIYIKKLAPNDNSKNQPYFGSHLIDLPFIPTGDIAASPSASSKTSDPKRRIKYQAALNFSWVDPEGNTYKAPNAKLIYYPQYPEVRFSGFLARSKVDASKWMDPSKMGRSQGRWLILGVSTEKTNKKIHGYLVTPESNLAKELESINFIEISNVFWQPSLTDSNTSKISTRGELINKLREIHNMGWIPSQKLNSNMSITPYFANNAAGYALESVLGIPPNSIAAPDYLGWEVKQFSVVRFPCVSPKITTLIAPEPNGGFYAQYGSLSFIKKYGYIPKNNEPDRLNFGGKHIVGTPHKLTGLTLRLIGFDTATASITDSEGSIALIDQSGNTAASWSFAKFMNHWKTKHSKTVFVPCLKQGKNETKTTMFRYGKDVELGVGTNFEMVLAAMNSGTICYDPGSRIKNISTSKPDRKTRNQFRTDHKNLAHLYKQYTFVDVEKA